MKLLSCHVVALNVLQTLTAKNLFFCCAKQHTTSAESHIQ